GILEQYVARRDWTKALLGELERHALATRMSRSGLGSVIYTLTSRERALAYAKSYADHGGEIAYLVWQTACHWSGRKLLPRYAGAEPVVLELAVPRDWVRWTMDTDALRHRLLRMWDEDPDSRTEFGSFAAFAQDATDMLEARIAQVIPADRIL